MIRYAIRVSSPGQIRILHTCGDRPPLASESSQRSVRGRQRGRPTGLLSLQWCEHVAWGSGGEDFAVSLQPGSADPALPRRGRILHGGRRNSVFPVWNRTSGHKRAESGRPAVGARWATVFVGLRREAEDNKEGFWNLPPPGPPTERGIHWLTPAQRVPRPTFNLV